VRRTIYARIFLRAGQLRADATAASSAAPCKPIHSQEPDMQPGDKSKTDKRKRTASAVNKNGEPTGAGRPQAGARPWDTANKLQGGGQKLSARQKVPFGPVGGSGRKTNLARSS
jgi:hypothetical protein